MAISKSSPSLSNVHASVRAASNVGEAVVPSQGQSWSSYWTIITGMTLIMLLLYLAANGLLSEWMKLFVFSTPNVVQNSSSSGTPAASSSGVGAALNSSTQSTMDKLFGLPSGTNALIDSLTGIHF